MANFVENLLNKLLIGEGVFNNSRRLVGSTGNSITLLREEENNSTVGGRGVN